MRLMKGTRLTWSGVMADITMCLNEGCPNEPHCYRRQATPSKWQSVATFEFQTSPGGVECEHYIPMFEATTKGGAD